MVTHIKGSIVRSIRTGVAHDLSVCHWDLTPYSYGPRYLRRCHSKWVVIINIFILPCGF